MPKESLKLQTPESGNDQPKIGDLVKGWDKTSHSEVEGKLVEEIKNSGGSATGKIRLASGEELEIFLPKKVDSEGNHPAGLVTSAESEPSTKESEPNPEEEDAEALITSWINRAREMKRNQASMLGDLLARQKITTNEFEEKTGAWKDMENDLEKFAKKFREKVITGDEYRDLVESWLLDREISEEYIRRLEIKKDEPKPVTPKNPEAPARDITPSGEAGEKIIPTPKSRIESQSPETDKEISRVISLFQKEAVKVREIALGRLEKLLTDKKITAEELETAKKGWDDFDKEKSSLEDQFKNKKIGPRDFTNTIITKGNELFSRVIALEKRPGQEAAATPISTETKKPASTETIAPPEEPFELPTPSQDEIDASFKSLQVLGLDKRAEELVLQGRSNQELVDELKISKRALVALITKLRLPKTRSGSEFEDWKSALEKPILVPVDATPPTPATETTQPPKPEVERIEAVDLKKIPSFLKDMIEERYAEAEKLGLIEDIKKLAEAGLGPTAILSQLVSDEKNRSRLSFGTHASDMVHSVIAKLGIPSKETGEWINDFTDESQTHIGETKITGPAKAEVPVTPTSSLETTAETTPPAQTQETDVKKETLGEKLTAARSLYAKLEYEKEKLKKDFSGEKEAELEEARKKYLETRREAFGEKEKAFRLEEEAMGGKNIDRRLIDAAARRFSSIGLATEFKEFYDAKTAAEAEDKEASVSKMRTLGRNLYKVGQWYSKLPLRYKLGISLGLGAASLASGSIIAAGLVGTGIWTQRILSGGATGIATEALMKKFQDKKLGKLVAERQEKLAEEFEKAATEVQGGDIAKGIADFLESRNDDIENQIGLSAIEIRKRKKRMAARRYLAAGAIGTLFASGLAGKAFAKGTDAIGDISNFHPLEKAGDLAGRAFRQIAEWGSAGKEWVGDFDLKDLNPLSSPDPAEISDKIPIPESAPDATIDTSADVASEKMEGVVRPGGSLWQTCRQMLGSSQITTSEFNHAWSTSTVDIGGVPIPISEVDLSHAGDKIIFVADPAGGHFEVHDLPDSFKLGTGDDLIDKVTEITNESAEATHIVNPETIAPPEVDLEPKTGAPQSGFEYHSLPDITTDTPDTNATPHSTDSVIREPSSDIKPDASSAETHAHVHTHAEIIPENIAHEAETTLENYCLLDQEELIKKTAQALKRNPDQPYLQKLLVFLQNHPLHEHAIENYNEAWGSSGLTETEYTKIKDLKVGEYLKRYGRDLFEYFPDEKNIDAAEISHRRGLAQILRNLFPGRSVKNLTIEKLLKMASFSR
ncbi:MAG: hypothetical protein G01um101420_66 [Parcubacteria group bacterium Gr01-1014_20]|nr:MAG: hypothetical protein G01um101420_66 [Parcubacteria group bacterium Gr01-1014_20]